MIQRRGGRGCLLALLPAGLGDVLGHPPLSLSAILDRCLRPDLGVGVRESDDGRARTAVRRLEPPRCCLPRAAFDSASSGSALHAHADGDLPLVTAPSTRRWFASDPRARAHALRRDFRDATSRPPPPAPTGHLAKCATCGTGVGPARMVFRCATAVGAAGRCAVDTLVHRRAGAPHSVFSALDLRHW